MNKKSNFFNLLDKIEQATSRYTMAHIEQAMAHMGVVCKLYRKKKERTTDEVYGIHGGSELSRLPSTSIYDQPFSEPITEENLGDIDIDNFNAGIVVNEEFDEIFDDSFYDAYEVTVLLNSFQWRSISRHQDSFLEDSDYAYLTSDIDIENGDILVVDKDDIELKFKCYYPQLIGNRNHMIYRFRLSNVQE